MLIARQPCLPVDLDDLATRDTGTLGRVFAEHCRARGLNPNLGDIRPQSELDWVLHHLVLTHDIWHVVTGWDNDEVGEYGLGAFYMGQLGAPSFFGYLIGLAALSTAFRRRSFRTFMDALVRGYTMGKQAAPLFGVDWSAHWNVAISDLRVRFPITPARAVDDAPDQRPMLDVPSTLPMRRK